MAEVRPAHRRRLRDMWRSAGWPYHDALELDLLAAGLLLRVWDGQGRETLRVSDAGIQALAAARRKSCDALCAHDTLVDLVACQMQRAGRLVWRGLPLRAALPPLPGDPGGDKPRWAVAVPDVFSIRHTTVEEYTEPIVHEVKVSRSDLLADLRRSAKGAAYSALSSQCWYVLRCGIAEPEEVPLQFGVLIADKGRLELARPAPRRPMRPPFSVWMALARHHAMAAAEDGATGHLCDMGEGGAGVDAAPIALAPAQ